MFFLFLLLAVHSGSPWRYKEETVMCPIPVRPFSITSHMNYTESDSLRIIMEVRFCISATQEREMYFRFNRFLINRDESQLPFFDIYDGFGMLPHECYVEVIYEPNNVRTETKMADLVTYHCDYQLSECTLVEWKCRHLKRMDYQDLVLRLLLEMFKKGEKMALSSTESTVHTWDNGPVDKLRSSNSKASLDSGWFYGLGIVLLVVFCSMIVYAYVYNV